MKNLNEYNKDAWISEFKKTDIFNRLENNFGRVLFEKRNTCIFTTPREQYGTVVTSGTIFYYLEKLFETNPKHVYDIGCGWNLFQKYYPQIIGIGAENPRSNEFHADIHDYFDLDFVKGHEKYFESAFSINALHFVPITEMKQRYIDFFKIIKPEGRGFLATNAQRFIDATSSDTLKSIFNSQIPNAIQLENYIRQEIRSFFAETSAIPIIIDILDFSYSENRDEFLDGNIRILFEKPENT